MTKAEANKRVRREILRIVRKFGMNGISFEGIEKIFNRAGMLGVAADLEENIHYLKGKGYVATEQVKDQFDQVERWMVTITPAGIDLLDEIIDPDPGVEIVC